MCSKEIIGIALRDIGKGCLVELGKDIQVTGCYPVGGIKMSESNAEGRGLFEIRAISRDTDEIVYKDEVVAEGESDALFESNLKEVLKEKKLKRDDVYVIVREFGSVPVKERTKTVRVVGKVGKMILGKEESK